MQPHKLAALTIRRGDPPKLDRAMGLATTGQRSRKFTQPLPADDNKFNGELSPTEKAKPFLCAVDDTNTEGADILLFDLEYTVKERRLRRVSVPRDDVRVVALNLARGMCEALTALLAPGLTQDEREERVIKAGGSLVRARMFVAGPDTDPANEMMLPRAA